MNAILHAYYASPIHGFLVDLYETVVMSFEESDVGAKARMKFCVYVCLTCLGLATYSLVDKALRYLMNMFGRMLLNRPNANNFDPRWVLVSLLATKPGVEITLISISFHGCRAHNSEFPSGRNFHLLAVDFLIAMLGMLLPPWHMVKPNHINHRSNSSPIAINAVRGIMPESALQFILRGLGVATDRPTRPTPQLEKGEGKNEATPK